MGEYRHVTNLRTPFDEIDAGFLQMLEDYRVGDPVPRAPQIMPDGAVTKPKTLAELKRDGVIGLYTTLAALRKPEVMRRTGWAHPERLLGEEWRDGGDEQRQG